MKNGLSEREHSNQSEQIAPGSRENACEERIRVNQFAGFLARMELDLSRRLSSETTPTDSAL
jgi:hypothetical protein